MTSGPDAAPLEPWVHSWDDLRREFEDSKAEIMAVRSETEKEGKERAKREARRQATRRDAEELDVVRFVSARNAGDVRDYLQAARDWIPDLEALFQNEVPTLQFLVSWGSFQLCYGPVAASCSREGDGFGALRIATKGGDARSSNSERKAKFVAALTLHWMARGEKRPFAERHAAESIAQVIAKSSSLLKSQVDWLESLLAVSSGKNDRPRL